MKDLVAWVEEKAFFILLFLNIAIFLIGFIIPVLVGNISLSENYEIVGSFSLQRFISGNYWEVVTNNFAHLELLHFGFNTYSFINIYKYARNFFDQSYIFITYIFGGVFAGILSVFLGFNAFLGASSAIFAILGLVIFLDLKSTGRDFFSFQNQLFNYLIISLIMPIFINNINVVGHMAGLFFGLVLALVYYKFFSNKVFTFITKLIFVFSLISTLMCYYFLYLKVLG